MFRKTFLLAFVAVLMPLTAQADQVYLHDGSVISGKIIEMSEGRLSVETGFAGVIHVKTGSVKGIQSEKPVMTQIDSGDRLSGTMHYDPVQGQQIYSNSFGAVAVNAADIDAVWQDGAESPQVRRMREDRQEKEEEMTARIAAEKEAAQERAEDVWSGSVKFGFAGAKGNTEEMKFDGKAAAKRETDFDRLTVSLQGRFESNDGQETKNEIIGTGKLERDITERLFAFTSLALEHDKFEEIDLRSNLTGGLGYFVIQEDDHEFKPRLGVGYEVTAYENDPTEKDVVLSLGYDYRVDMFDKLRFTHGFTYLPAFDDLAADYRIDSDAALAYPIDDAKSWNVELGLQHQYDSMPSEGVEELDTYYSLGLSRKFD